MRVHQGVRTNTHMRGGTSVPSWSKAKRKHCLNTKLLKDVLTCPAGYFRLFKHCLYSLESASSSGYLSAFQACWRQSSAEFPPRPCCWCHLLNTLVQGENQQVTFCSPPPDVQKSIDRHLKATVGLKNNRVLLWPQRCTLLWGTAPEASQRAHGQPTQQLAEKLRHHLPKKGHQGNACRLSRRCTAQPYPVFSAAPTKWKRGTRPMLTVTAAAGGERDQCSSLWQEDSEGFSSTICNCLDWTPEFKKTPKLKLPTERGSIKLPPKELRRAISSIALCPSQEIQKLSLPSSAEVWPPNPAWDSRQGGTWTHQRESREEQTRHS